MQSILKAYFGGGAMIALPIEPKEAAQFAQCCPPGAIQAIKPEDMHISLFVWDDYRDVDAKAVKSAASKAAARLSAFNGKAQGIGIFMKDGDDVLYASVSSPEIDRLREIVKEEFAYAGIPLPKSDYGFVPHVTLGYFKQATCIPTKAPTGDLPLQRLLFALDEDKTFFGLNGIAKHLPGKHDQKDHGNRISEGTFTGKNFNLDERDLEEIRDVFKSAGWEDMDDEEISAKVAKMVGISDDYGYTSVTVEVHDDAIGFTLENNMFYAERTFDFNDMTVYNHSLSVDEDLHGSGIGTQLFVREVEEASRNGFKSISTAAVRDSESNGYYTWPLLGYDGPTPWVKGISSKESEKFEKALSEKPEFRKIKTLSELYSTEGGRSWWKKNGRGVSVTFNLKQDSKSRKILKAYLEEKERK